MNLEKEISEAKQTLVDDGVGELEKLGRGTSATVFRYKNLAVRKDHFTTENDKLDSVEAQQTEFIARCNKAVERGINIVPTLDYIMIPDPARDNKKVMYSFMPLVEGVSCEKEKNSPEEILDCMYKIEVNEFVKYFTDFPDMLKCGLSRDNYMDNIRFIFKDNKWQILRLDPSFMEIDHLTKPLEEIVDAEKFQEDAHYKSMKLVYEIFDEKNFIEVNFKKAEAIIRKVALALEKLTHAKDALDFCKKFIDRNFDIQIDT